MSMFTSAPQKESLAESEKQKKLKKLEDLVHDIAIYIVIASFIFNFCAGVAYALMGKPANNDFFMVVSFSCWSFFLSKHKTFLWDAIKDIVVHFFTKATITRLKWLLGLAFAALAVWAFSDAASVCGRACLYSLQLRNLSHAFSVSAFNLALSQILCTKEFFDEFYVVADEFKEESK